MLNSGKRETEFYFQLRAALCTYSRYLDFSASYILKVCVQFSSLPLEVRVAILGG